MRCFLFLCLCVCQCSVTVVQLLDSRSGHEWHLDCVEVYSKVHNATLLRRFMPVLERHVDALLRKPSELRLVLSSLPHNDWILYLDWDVCVVEKQFSPKVLVQKVIGATRRSSKCHFVAQDTKHTVNSGVLFIRNSNLGRAILDRWIAHVEMRKNQLARTNYPHDPLGDQRAMTNFFMEAAWRSRQKGEHVQNWQDRFASNSSRCFDLTDAHDSNVCFERYLRELGFPVNEREFGGVCLVSPSQLRFNMHDCGHHYSAGDLFYHGHAQLNW
jgi:hypothetical protein